jgi:site-specific recombinase XerD
MLLYRSSVARAAGALGLDGAAEAVLQRCGVRGGQPFVLGPDGSYDLNLNRFLRELDGWGVRSAHTVQAYARDLMLFGRFLHEQRGGRSLWQADQEDLRAYKRARRRTPGFEVSAATWNRFLAALDKWVQWALHERLLVERPFRMVERTVLGPRGLVRVIVNAEREVDDDCGPVRFLPYVDYLLWRDVGLRGQLPDGGPDPRWRGRHGWRNAVFADLLVCTGMRLSEASSLLLPEVPAVTDRAMTGAVQLASAVTKRNRARTVFVVRRVLRDLHHWVGMERDELVARKMAAGAYREVGDWVGVRSAGRMALTMAGGGSRPYARITIEERRRLNRLDAGGAGEPLWLWLGENGLPLSSSTWQAVFCRANERCARFGLDVRAHPHTLRHTFAVHMLGLLLRQTVRALRREPGETLMSQQVKRQLVGDPLRKLQLLLGHRHRETTFVYLDVLDEAQEIVLAALDEWDEQAEALSRVRAEDDQR